MTQAIPWSFHTHNAFCDGVETIEAVVRAAIAANLSDIGVSSHAPLPFATDWNMSLALLPTYVRQVCELRGRYKDQIAIWLGAEIDYIPGEEVERFQHDIIFAESFDYFVGSVHFLGSGYPPRSFDGTRDVYEQILREDYRGEIRPMVEDYYSRVRELLRLPRVKIVGHLDVIKRWNAVSPFFTEEEAWYLESVEATLQAVTQSDAAVEVNTAGWRKGLDAPYPSVWILERCRDLNIPVTVSADSHSPAEVNWGFERAAALLDALGIQAVRPPIS